MPDEDCSHDWQILTTQPWAPYSKRNRHPSHCWNSGKRKEKGVGGELPGRWAAILQNAREHLLYVRHVTLRYDPQSYGIEAHAHLCQHCWPPRERKRSLLLTLLNYILMTTFKTGQFGIISKCDKLISFNAEHAYKCMQSFRWISRVEFGCSEFFSLCSCCRSELWRTSL